MNASDDATAPKPGAKGHRIKNSSAGRKKGSTNIVTRLSENERIEIAKRQGITPLDFLMSVLREPDLHTVDVTNEETGEITKELVGVTLKQKIEVARATLPYMHKRMPIAIEGGDKPIAVFDIAALSGLSTPELEGLMALLGKLNLDPAVGVATSTATAMGIGAALAESMRD